MNMEKPESIRERHREMYLKSVFFEYVVSGSKTTELRVAFEAFSHIKVDDKVVFKSGDGRSIQVEITDVTKYHDLDEVLRSADISKLVPNMSKEQIQKAASIIFSEADVKKYGLVLFAFKKMQ